jgi:hypothetical protein
VPPGEEFRLQGATEQRDLRLWVSLQERVERRQREDKVPQPAGPEDGNIPDVLY